MDAGVQLGEMLRGRHRPAQRFDTVPLLSYMWPDEYHVAKTELETTLGERARLSEVRTHTQLGGDRPHDDHNRRCLVSKLRVVWAS